MIKNNLKNLSPCEICHVELWGIFTTFSILRLSAKHILRRTFPAESFALSAFLRNFVAVKTNKREFRLWESSSTHFTDVGFKIIFGQEFSKPRLIDFLNALLVGERCITDLSFLDKE